MWIVCGSRGDRSSWAPRLDMLRIGSSFTTAAVRLNPLESEMPRALPSGGKNMRRVIGATVGLLALCGAPEPVAAQGRVVTGHVIDAVTSAVLPRAQITVKGEQAGAISKDDGSFSIAAPTGDLTLVARLIGYKRREVPVTADRETVNIQLEIGRAHV